MDTPGVVASSSIRNSGHGQRVAGAWAAASTSEAVLFVVDLERQLRDPDPRVERTLRTVAPTGSGSMRDAFENTPFFLVLNKIDLLPPRSAVEVGLERLKEQLHELRDFERTFEVSAKRGWGCEALLEAIMGRAGERQWEMGGAVSDHTEATLASEIVRERLFHRFNQELPYGLEIVKISCRPLKDGSLRIEQHIYVPHNSVKKIVVGRGGEAIRDVGVRARKELQHVLDRTVHLIITVKVRKKKNAQYLGDQSDLLASLIDQ